MGQEEAVLFVNDRFYAAFAGRDMAAMEGLWSAHGVTCVHPGWPPLFGRDDVMESWQSILGEGGGPDVRCRSPRVQIYGDTAVVICFEQLEAAFLCATNIFLKHEGEWYMVHHQAGPVHVEPKDLPDEPDIAMN